MYLTDKRRRFHLWGQTCQHEIYLLLVPFAFRLCISAVWQISWTWTYPRLRACETNLYNKKMIINHRIFFFVHFQSKIISNFQLDRKKSQMTSNFRNAFPSLHIPSVEKSVEYISHQQRDAPFAIHFPNARTYSHRHCALTRRHKMFE